MKCYGPCGAGRLGFGGTTDDSRSGRQPLRKPSKNMKNHQKPLKITKKQERQPPNWKKRPRLSGKNEVGIIMLNSYVLE